MTKIKVGSDFSGVGAFNQALIRLGIDFEEVFACDMDKYARQTFELNYGAPKYFPKDVYEREIPSESLDIYMTSPPCQSFSLAGKRLGKEDKRGILFFNSLEFIQVNKPRYFIFENVKGLLSHDKVDPKAEFGRTFQEWSNLLGGKSVNGVHTFFPYEDSVPYHIYFQVLNAKHYGIPQNRERIFIIGIRDDEDNDFQFPKPFPLEKRLKDVLESEVDEKYFLSDSNINALIKYNERQIENERGFSAKFRNPDEVETMDALKVGGGSKDDLIKIGTSKTLEAPIVEFQLTGGKWDKTHEQSGRVYDKNGIEPTIHTMGGGNQEPKIAIRAIRGRNPDNPKSRQSGLETEQMLEINENGTSNALTTVQKDNVVVYDFNNKRLNETLKNNILPDEVAIIDSYNQTINTEHSHTISTRINASSCSHVLIPTNNSKGFDQAEEEEDSINFSVPSSKTRRGRVGKKVSQTLDTQCNQGIVTKKLSKQQLEKLENLQVDENIAGCITHAIGRAGSSDEYIASVKRNAMITQRIRRLTPKEAFRLMDFNPEMIDKTIESKLISDSQLYKQAGNSICVGVLAAIIQKFKL